MKGTGIVVTGERFWLRENPPVEESTPSVTDPEAVANAVTVNCTGVDAVTETDCEVGLKFTNPVAVPFGVSPTVATKPDAGLTVTVKKAEDAAGKLVGPARASEYGSIKLKE